MVNWTSDALNDYNRRQAHKAGNRGDAHSSLQKLEADGPKPKKRKAQADYGPRAKGPDESDHPVFRVAIVVKYSDHRTRDLPGALETLCDCLVLARRRLVEMDFRH